MVFIVTTETEVISRQIYAPVTNARILNPGAVNYRSQRDFTLHQGTIKFTFYVISTNLLSVHLPDGH